MQGRGFEEEKQAPYKKADLKSLIGQIRRLGEAGPAYEVISVDESAGIAVIEIIESDERVNSPLADVLNDPIAETIP